VEPCSIARDAPFSRLRRQSGQRIEVHTESTRCAFA
jgi:hypothetical protein